MRKMLFSVLFFCCFAGTLLAQDQLLLQAEALWGSIHSLQMAASQSSHPALQQQIKAKTTALDSLFMQQESQMASHTLVSGPKVKAPEGALALLRHERHAILNYYCGAKMLHAFVVTRKETRYFAIPLPPQFPKQIDTFVCGIADPERLLSLAQFRSLSHALYTTLIAPLEDNIAEIDQLTIVPAPLFATLPFELLIRTDSPSAKSFRALPYLLQDFGIGYANSISHLAHLQEIRTQRPEGIQLVQEDIASQALPAALQAEIKALEADWDIHQPPHNASQNLSTAQQAQRRILHFPGGIQAPSQLSLGNCAGVLITLPEINEQGCHLGTNSPFLQTITRLEACHARAIMTATWPTEAASRLPIVQSFFAALADRQYVDQALRFARLRYLEQADDAHVHPHFWAGFRQVNDFAPVRAQPNFPWYIVLAGGLLLIVLFGKKF